MDGSGISVDFDGRQLVVQSTNALSKIALGTSRLVLETGDISSVTMKDAGLVRPGRLDLVAQTGRRYMLPFTRPQQAAFAELHRALIAARGGQDASAPVPPSRPTAPPPRAAVATPDAVVVLRGRGYFNQQVVGESHYFRALRGVAGRAVTGEREVVVELRREPGNRHDRNAVQVVLEGHVVGYLPREAALEYGVPLERLERSGRRARCRARLWWSRDGGEFIASVSLDLDEPGLLLPVNAIDEQVRHLVVPSGRLYQLSRENEHMDVLGPLMARAYAPGKVLVLGTLHLSERVGPRSTSHIVVVRVDGEEIGELTKQTSGKLTSLLQPLQNAGVTCYAEVVLTGNALAVEAKLSVSPPEELPSEFVKRVEQELRHAG